MPRSHCLRSARALGGGLPSISPTAAQSCGSVKSATSQSLTYWRARGTLKCRMSSEAPSSAGWVQGCHAAWTSSGMTRLSGITRENGPLVCTASCTPRLLHRVWKVSKLLEVAMKM